MFQGHPLTDVRCCTVQLRLAALLNAGEDSHRFYFNGESSADDCLVEWPQQLKELDPPEGVKPEWSNGIIDRVRLDHITLYVRDKTAQKVAMLMMVTVDDI